MKKILVIDDEEKLTEMIRLTLEQDGQYMVMTENRGSSGLAAAKEFKPDLILLDVMMPDMEGPDVAAQIKADERVKNTPIVFLTAVVTKEEAAATGGLIGGYPFIAKPLNNEALISCIEEHIRR
ncbi:response regulator transcription factor [Candidatus Omnitrophota bacterium]